MATNGAAHSTIDSIPAAGQRIEHQGLIYNTIKEGRAHILVPPDAKTVTDPKKQDSDEQAQNVFYNPIQQFNRDLSVLAIRAFAQDYLERRNQKAEQKSSHLRNKKLRKKRKDAARAPAEAGDATKGAIETSNNADSGAPKEPVVAADVEGTTAVGDVQGTVATVEEVAGGRKRKAYEDLDESTSKGKRQKTTNDHADQAPVTETQPAEVHMDAPARAASLPTGERPDDNKRTTLRILDALSATGLRALRYASELPFPTFVVANDLLPNATTAIKLNVHHNRLTNSIHATTSNAQAHMYAAAYAHAGHTYGKYDVIDLDPYGTAVPFLEAALLALNDNGMLAVTCTDAGVFNSLGYLEKAFALYGGVPIKGLHTHEGGVRLILHAIATTAAKHGLAIEPLLSLSIDFYARVFVRVRRSPAEVKFVASKTVVVHGCDSGCGAWEVQSMARTSVSVGRDGKEFFKYHPAQTGAEKTCTFCGCKSHLAGPMWGGPLHNPWFVGRVLGLLDVVDGETYQTKQRIEGMLSSALDELEVLGALEEVGADRESKLKQARRISKKADAVAAGKGATDTDSDAAIIVDDDALNINANPASLKDTGIGALDDAPAGGSGDIPIVPAHITDPHPFSVNGSHLAKVLKCRAPPEAAIKGALRHMGYVATRSHARPGMIKTQAPWSVIWDMMRTWIREKAPIKEGSLRVGSPGWNILNSGKAVTNGVHSEDPKSVSNGDVDMNGNGTESRSRDAERDSGVNDTIGTAEEVSSAEKDDAKAKIVFDETLGRDRPGKRLVRYQMNPRANWGPMSKAKG